MEGDIARVPVQAPWQRASVVHILQLDPPKTKELDFETAFKKAIEHDAVTDAILKRVTILRKELLVAQERQYADSALKGVEKYLPLLTGLKSAADALPPESTSYLKIAWTSVLSERFYLKEPFTHSDWYFEVVNVLFIYALLSRKLAWETLNAIPTDRFDTECITPVKHLRVAAGVLNYIASNVCGHFLVETSKFPVPELYSETYQILSSISLAEAQSIMVKKAVLAGKMSLTGLAQLCAGITERFSAAARSVDNVDQGLQKEVGPQRNSFFIAGLKVGINKNVREYLVLNRAVFKGLVYYFLGLHHAQQASPGWAVAYLRKACDVVKGKKLDLTDWCPYTNELSAFYTKLEEVRALFIGVRDELTRDNENIYHERVREERELEWPVPKQLATPIDFVPPPEEPVKLTQKEGWSCTVQ